MKNRFTFIKSKMTLLNYAIAIIAMTSAFFLPLSFYDENGIFEFLEAFTLLIAATFCFVEYKKKRNFSSFFLTIGLLMLIFIGRELSWGRTFFHNELGEVVKRRDWIFGPYIYYIVGPMVLAVVVHAYKTKFVQNGLRLLAQAPIMIFDFLLVILMISVSTWAESDLFPACLAHWHFAIEESAEVILYLAVAIIISTYSRKNLLEKIEDIK